MNVGKEDPYIYCFCDEPHSRGLKSTQPALNRTRRVDHDECVCTVTVKRREFIATRPRICETNSLRSGALIHTERSLLQIVLEKGKTKRSAASFLETKLP